MAYRVEITDRALRDLALIYQRIEAETGARAARWFDGLEAAINGLERRPHRAPATPEDGSLRHLLYGKRPHAYRIIYAIEDAIATVYVLHIRAPGRAKMPRR
jgi:toxin ParE1/3/4